MPSKQELESSKTPTGIITWLQNKLWHPYIQNDSAKSLFKQKTSSRSLIIRLLKTNMALNFAHTAHTCNSRVHACVKLSFLTGAKKHILIN